MKTIDEYRELGFGTDQLVEIEEGLKSGVDVSIYARLEYVSIQMRQIRLGLEEGLPVDLYASTDYDWFQMEEIRKGLLNGVSVGIYSDPSISFDRMRQIRKGLQANIDLSPYKHLDPGVLRVLRRALVEKVSIIKYISAGYDEKQLDEIRIALSKGLDIDPYLNKQFRGVCIREIAEGLNHNIDVSVYASTEYNWRQMREIRLGLENRIEVKSYSNPYYDWEQMQEIRLGLMHGIEIVTFRSLMYPGAEMREKRLALEKEAKEREEYWENRVLAEDGSFIYQESFVDKAPKKKEYKEFTVVISPDEMEAYFVMKEKPHPINKGIIDDALETYGITHGLNDLALSRVVNGDWKEERFIVAKGELPVNGEDGHYDFLFRTEVARSPKVLPDGSVDYHDIEWYEMTHKGDMIAEYHHATPGKCGYTVLGTAIPEKKGVELPILTGSGFKTDQTGDLYIATADGIVILKDDHVIEIKSLLVLDEVSLATGNVKYEGSVHIKGNVFSGMSIETGGDLVIDGYVEKVTINCGGNVILHQGVNASGEGLINAAGDVIGTFFEAVTVRSGGCIRANYSMNSNLYAEDSIKINGRKGSLVGGIASAENSIEVFELGNKAAMATMIRLSTHDAPREKLRIVAAQLSTVYDELEALRKAYKEYKNNFAPEVRNYMPIFLKIEAAIYTKELQANELGDTKRELEEALKDNDKAEIIVRGSLYEGVSIVIGNAKLLSKEVRRVRIKLVDKHVGMFSI